MQTRNEHLEWCKKRALEYIEVGDIKNAFASFQSDMTKHPETEGHLALSMGTILLLGGQLKTQSQMTEWINGFN